MLKYITTLSIVAIGCLSTTKAFSEPVCFCPVNYVDWIPSGAGDITCLQLVETDVSLNSCTFEVSATFNNTCDYDVTFNNMFDGELVPLVTIPAGGTAVVTDSTEDHTVVNASGDGQSLTGMTSVFLSWFLEAGEYSYDATLEVSVNCGSSSGDGTSDDGGCQGGSSSRGIGFVALGLIGLLLMRRRFRTERA